jgi:ornithine cyclodeaminase
MSQNLNLVPFVSVDSMMKLVHAIGVERFLVELAGFIEADFKRWEIFDKTPRVASHSAEGVIELMPTSDGAVYGFKYVNGHPKNTRDGRPDRHRLRRAGRCRDRLSAALDRDDHPDRAAHRRDLGAGAKYLAPPRAPHDGDDRQWRAVRVPGARLQGAARRRSVRLYDIDPASDARVPTSPPSASTSSSAHGRGGDARRRDRHHRTADKQNATILTDNMVGPGVHINAVGGDCPGKTELHADILKRAGIFVEYPPQTRIEGEIQQLAADYPVTELWQVIAGAPRAGAIAADHPVRQRRLRDRGFLGAALCPRAARRPHGADL